MVIIHNIEDDLISFEVPSLCSISTASSILSKLKEDVYVDWEFILEELHETKKINVLVMKSSHKDKIVIVSVDEYDLVAVIPS